MGGLRTRSRSKRKPRKAPAEGAILSRERALRASKVAGGGTLKNTYRVQLDVIREMAYDLDMRKIVEHVSVGMAEFYRDQLKKGRTPEGGPIPRASIKTLRGQFGHRRSPWLGMRSGWMAENWWLGKIKGGPFKAQRLVKPNGSGGGPTPQEAGRNDRGFTINNLLARKPPVDFQGVTGAANTRMKQLFNEAISMGWPEIRTDVKAKTSQGTLPKLRRRR